jgi:hypothetical protein
LEDEMKYIKVTRSDTKGSYIQEKKDLPYIMDNEFDDFDDLDLGVSITLTVVEMSPEKYAKLPEFIGW